jgi:hypothetical protein
MPRATSEKRPNCFSGSAPGAAYSQSLTSILQFELMDTGAAIQSTFRDFPSCPGMGADLRSALEPGCFRVEAFA